MTDQDHHDDSNFEENPFIPHRQYDPFAQDSMPLPTTDLGWQEIWQIAVTNGSVENYRYILRDVNLSANRALKWLFWAFVGGGVINIFTQQILGINQINRFSFNQPINQRGFQTQNVETNQDAFLSLICGVPIGVAVILLLTVVLVALVHTIGRSMGGQGDFEENLYLAGAIIAPLTLISALFGIVPLLGPLAQIFAFLYSISLAVIAVRAVHGLEWGASIISVIGGGIAFVMVFICCGVALLSILF